MFVSEMGTNMVVVDDDMRLMKGIPVPSEATTDYAAARVKYFISSLYKNKLVLLSNELAVGNKTQRSIEPTQSAQSGVRVTKAQR